MLTKDSLREEFSKNSDKFYRVKLFEEEGFTRKQCPKCGRYFWSIEKQTCGDSGCEPYSFFTNKGADYIDIWKKFNKFFVKNGHESTPRYPVICRWREDLYFTIASIVDFMRLEHGSVVFEYPSNPLVVPQMCLRFNDIPNVGVTGRHFSCFMMAGQHAFNPPKQGYWKDRCIELNYGFLHKTLGIPKNELTYREDVWAMPDLSSFGPCVETFANGLEIVNSVFMQYTKTGDNSYKELSTKVIDVGWGFERIVWYAAGTPTAYDCAFGPVTEKLIKQSGISYDKNLFLKYAKISGAIDMDEVKNVKQVRANIAKQLGVSEKELNSKISSLEALYAIADHARTLAFAVADGGLPSNVGGGYNLRVILRRALGFLDEFKYPFKLYDVAEMHANYLKPLFPELQESLPELQQILETEEKRYGATLERSKRLLSEVVKQNTLTNEKMKELYESQGITPELVEEVASSLGKNISVPTDFYAQLTNTHVFAKQEEVQKFDFSNLEPTTMLYYESEKLEDTAKIIAIRSGALVLDKTLFYPEGGGQAADLGEIDGKKVKDVQKVKGVIFHVMDTAGFKAGQKVKCTINSEFRAALKRHHSATHVLGASARKILGKHVWQAGAKKEGEKAHLDITHFEKLTPEELEKIELLANEIVLQNLPVKVTEMERGKAEQKYGFILYQGGGSPGKKVRVVEISGIDAEACGGLHVSRTGEIGMIKIIREERIQDGVNRLEFCAGLPAARYIQKQQKILESAALKLNVAREQLPSSVERFFEEWKERGKKLEALEDSMADELAVKLLKETKEMPITLSMDAEASVLKKLALKLLSQSASVAAVLTNNSNDIVCIAGESSSFKANELLKQVCSSCGGGGGGSEKLAMGRTKGKVDFSKLKK
ncbi:MAG: alanine--tRNA ligase [Candidatus Micrarchaeota archaeon]